MRDHGRRPVTAAVGVGAGAAGSGLFGRPEARAPPWGSQRAELSLRMPAGEGLALRPAPGPQVPVSREAPSCPERIKSPSAWVWTDGLLLPPSPCPLHPLFYLPSEFRQWADRHGWSWTLTPLSYKFPMYSELLNPFLRYMMCKHFHPICDLLLILNLAFILFPRQLLLYQYISFQFLGFYTNEIIQHIYFSIYLLLVYFKIVYICNSLSSTDELYMVIHVSPLSGKWDCSLLTITNRCYEHPWMSFVWAFAFISCNTWVNILYKGWVLGRCLSLKKKKKHQIAPQNC